MMYAQATSNASTPATPLYTFFTPDKRLLCMERVSIITDKRLHTTGNIHNANPYALCVAHAEGNMTNCFRSKYASKKCVYKFILWQTYFPVPNGRTKVPHGALQLYGFTTRGNACMEAAYPSLVSLMFIMCT